MRTEKTYLPATIDSDEFINEFYKYLMAKYNWTTTQIDEEDFWLLWELEFKDLINPKDPENEIMTIDEVRRRALNGEFK